MLHPSADAIQRAFPSHSHRHLLLTGGRGSGKSTLFSALSAGMPTLKSWAEPQKAVYLHWGNTTLPIGRYDPSVNGRENRMQPLETLNTEAPALLERLAETDSPWVAIDEIGYLEQTAPRYCEALLRLFDRKRVLAVVRKQPLPLLTALLRRPDAFAVDLDAPYGHIGCVIMAAGFGRRFGGHKLLAELGGQPLYRYSLEATEGIFEKRIVVTREESIAAFCDARGIPVIMNPLPYQSDTIRLGLGQLWEMDSVAFCPADQPLLRQETVAALAIHSAGIGEGIIRPTAGARIGAPVVFSRRFFPALMALQGETGGKEIIARDPASVQLVPVRNADELDDVDTREDIPLLEKRRGTERRNRRH